MSPSNSILTDLKTKRKKKRKKYSYPPKKYAVMIRPTGEVVQIDFTEAKTVAQINEAAHKLVGDDFQCIRLPNDIMMVVDENGKLKNKKENPYASFLYGHPDDYIVGNAVFLKVNGTRLEPFSSREAYNLGTNFEIDERIRGLR